MGTNYYLSKGRCECCNRAHNEIHIGKASAGWKFLFHATEEFRSFEAWLKIILEDDSIIINEYNEIISKHNFIMLVVEKQKSKNAHNTDARHFTDKLGYDFSENDFS